MVLKWRIQPLKEIPRWFEQLVIEGEKKWKSDGERSGKCGRILPSFWIPAFVMLAVLGWGLRWSRIIWFYYNLKTTEIFAKNFSSEDAINSRRSLVCPTRFTSAYADGQVISFCSGNYLSVGVKPFFSTINNLRWKQSTLLISWNAQLLNFRSMWSKCCSIVILLNFKRYLSKSDGLPEHGESFISEGPSLKR